MALSLSLSVQHSSSHAATRLFRGHLRPSTLTAPLLDLRQLVYDENAFALAVAVKRGKTIGQRSHYLRIDGSTIRIPQHRHQLTRNVRHTTCSYPVLCVKYEM
jgi:hypothetical protein